MKFISEFDNSILNQVYLFFFFRWPTRVFATECLRMIVIACEVDETHFDMEKARNRKNTTGQGMSICLALCMYLLNIL